MNLQLQRELSDAAWDGDAARVRVLIGNPEVDPGAHHSNALMHAAHRGKLDCVLLLLARSNPNARNAEPLWRAARYGRRQCVLALRPVSDTSGWAQWQWDELPPAMRRLLPGPPSH